MLTEESIEPNDSSGTTANSLPLDFGALASFHLSSLEKMKIAMVESTLMLNSVDEVISLLAKYIKSAYFIEFLEIHPFNEFYQQNNESSARLSLI